MKEITFTRYVADDGEEFASPQECEEYEAEHCPTFPHIYIDWRTATK